MLWINLATGDKFQAGDVLLEIETDKAQMDVEAQDDGVMGKIVIQGGSHKVAVGSIIAVLAEEGDELSDIKVPKENNDTQQMRSEHNSSDSSPTPSKDKAGELNSAHSTGSHHTYDPSLRLTPAVLFVLRQFDVSDPSKIKGSGPKGRILKGDVLAFAGQIDNKSVATLNQNLKKRSAIDVSSVVKSDFQKKGVEESAKQIAQTETLSTTITLANLVQIQHNLLCNEYSRPIQRLIELDQLGYSQSLDSIIEKASTQALRDVPAVRKRPNPMTDFFDELGGSPPTRPTHPSTSIFKAITPQTVAPTAYEEAPIILPPISPVLVSAGSFNVTLDFTPAAFIDHSSHGSSADLFDEILGNSKKVKHLSPALNANSTTSVDATFTFDITATSREHAKAYLSRVRFYLEHPAELFL